MHAFMHSLHTIVGVSLYSKMELKMESTNKDSITSITEDPMSTNSSSSPESSPTLSPKPFTQLVTVDPSRRELILSLPNLHLMECHGQIRELQTIIRNKSVT